MHPDPRVPVLELCGDVAKRKSTGSREPEKETDVRVEETQAIGRLNEIGVGPAADLVDGNERLDIV